MKFFDYGEEDFIPSELSGKRAVDINHIHPRSQRPDLLNDITNLIALTREEHDRYGDKKQWVEFLQNIHNEFMKNHGKNN
jgi:hypothetical protein